MTSNLVQGENLNQVEPSGHGVVNSHNEWDRLQEAIVGHVHDAVVPELDAAVRTNTYAHHLWFYEQYGGRTFPSELIEKANAELDEFCRVLEGEGVRVRRPDVVDFQKRFETPDFAANGMYATMPRDILLTVGNEIIEAPMAWRSRFFEYRPFRRLMKEYLRGGARWTTAPKPMMSDELYDEAFAALPAETRQRLTIEENRYVTTEFEPCFDAADFVRCGKDIFVQRSHVTNLMGILWMRNHLAGRYNLHLVDFNDANPMHVDASLVPLRAGLAMANPERPCSQKEIFTKAGWEIIEAVQPTVPDDWPLYMASRWLSINLIILDEKRVILEKDEAPLHRQFRDLGFEVIPVAFRHVYPFGGSFHCVTCDIRRESRFESYGFADPVPLEELPVWLL